MGREDANKAYTLYSLCRLIDDIADNPKNDQNELYQLKKYLWNSKQGSFIHYKGLDLPEIILEDLFKGMFFFSIFTRIFIPLIISMFVIF